VGGRETVKEEASNFEAEEEEGEAEEEEEE